MRWMMIFLLIFSLGFCDEEYEEGFHIPKDLSYLHLTNEQKLKLKKILKEHREVLEKLHKKEENVEKELKKFFLQDRFDKRAFFKKNLELKREIAKTESDFFEKIHSILDKNQRKKFIKYLEEWEIE